MSETTPDLSESSPSPGAKSGRWLSRLFVGVIFLWIGGFGIGALFMALNPPKGGKDVVSPFKPWEGDWEGEVVAVNATTGATVSRTKYKQTYRHVAASKDFRQEGYFEAREGAGPPRKEKGLNRSQFDGSLLRRKTLKQGGQVVFDYLGLAASGSILWRRAIPGATELIRETVEGDRYLVEGWGLYADQPCGLVIMLGEFRRAEPRPNDGPARGEGATNR